jgi:glutathione-specific gamma-glutamylcyclotransferase
MLGLDRGGSCRGLVYRVVQPSIRERLLPVWQREMRANGYRARWVKAETEIGPIWAITFVAHRDGERYAGYLLDDEIADRIALGCGHIGPSAEYLLETVTRCKELGIHDRHLWRIQGLVAERLMQRQATPASRSKAAGRTAGLVDRV